MLSRGWQSFVFILKANVEKHLHRTHCSAKRQSARQLICMVHMSSLMLGELAS